MALTDKLLRELPSILNWAIAGWQRLQARRYFVQPKSSREAVEQLEDLASPIGAFLRERCVTNAPFEIEKSRLFEGWTSWCASQGQENPGNMAWFARNLRAACPTITPGQRRSAVAVVPVFKGVILR